MYKQPADPAASAEALKFFDWAYKNGKQGRRRTRLCAVAGRRSSPRSKRPGHGNQRPRRQACLLQVTPERRIVGRSSDLPIRASSARPAARRVVRRSFEAMTETAMPQIKMAGSTVQSRAARDKALCAQRQFLSPPDAKRCARRAVDPWRRDRIADQGLDPGVSGVRPRLLHDSDLESGHREIRRPCADFRNGRHLRHRDGDRRAGRHRHRHFSHRAVSARVAAADRHRHRAVGGNPEHYLRNLGPVRVRAVSPAIRATRSSSRCSPTFR